MRALILGGTGLLGRALRQEAQTRGFSALTAARNNADFIVDITDEQSLQTVLAAATPDMVINAAANVDLAACEADPAMAYLVNARPAALLAKWSCERGKLTVHVSTDQLFDGDGAASHDEHAAICLVNEYARSKFAAESFALCAPQSLVLRTSIAGFHPDGRGFADWAMDALSNRKPLTLFDDFYGSTMDAPSFAVALFDLLAAKARGRFNLASREVSSKKQFILGLAAAAGIEVDWAKTGSVATLSPRRARSLGLDVGKAEACLARQLPGRDAVCTALVRQWRERT